MGLSFIITGVVMAVGYNPALKITTKNTAKWVKMTDKDNPWKTWLITALACLTLVMATVYAFQRMSGAQANPTENPLQLLHDALLADPSSVAGNWLRTLNPAVKHVQGDLVWNSRQQQGVMRIRYLPNPKTNDFYQLWLYDAQGKPEQQPVAGGILKKGAENETLYAVIKPVIPVQEPYKFVLKLHAATDPDAGQVLLMVQP